MTHAVVLVTCGVIGLYVALLLFLWLFQEKIVFQPPAYAPPSAVSARQVRYRTADGVELFAFVVGECTSGTTTVLAFHGNADLARWFVPWAIDVVRETGACVVLPELRGYDGLPGPPTYVTSAHDARGALRFVREELGVTPAELVYFGHSLGAAIAAELAAVEPPAALVLQSPFSSARAMGARMIVPGISTFWLMISRVHFDTVQRVRSLSSPVSVTHGDRDLIIPARMGREVFDAAARKGELLIVNGAGHNDVPEVGREDYWRWLRAAVGVSRTMRGDLARDGTRNVTRDAPTGT